MLTQVAFIVGIMYTMVGMLKLGWLTNFISHSVIAGFMSGAAITIGLSQVCLLDCHTWHHLFRPCLHIVASTLLCAAFRAVQRCRCKESLSQLASQQRRTISSA